MRKKAIMSCILLVFSVCGCSSSAVKYKGYDAKYSWGTLKSDLGFSLEQVYSASIIAVELLDIGLIESSSDAMTATVIARDIQNDLVRVIIRKYAEDKINLRVLVGDLGNRRKSELIFQSIIKNLEFEAKDG